jgi:hypothetical protein
MGRRKKPVDPNHVEQLAAIFCTKVEMSSVLGVHKRTLEKRFGAVIAAGRAKGRMSIKRAQYKVAVTKENTQMLIWLGKQHLGQADKIENNNKNEASFQSEQVEQLVKWLESLEHVK